MRHEFIEIWSRKDALITIDHYAPGCHHLGGEAIEDDEHGLARDLRALTLGHQGDAEEDEMR